MNKTALSCAYLIQWILLQPWLFCAQADESLPNCDRIKGDAGVYISLDEGKSFIRPIEPPSRYSYVWGLTAMKGGLLIASRNEHLFYSKDSGCQWYQYNGSYPPLILTASLRNIAYGYSYFRNGQELYRFERLKPVRITSPLDDDEQIYTVEYFDHHPFKIRLVATNGQVYESKDGGKKWRRISVGIQHSNSLSISKAVISKQNKDHMLVAAQTEQILFTFDGGHNWNRAIGIPAGAIIHNVIMSTSNSQIAWACVIEPAKERNRSLYISKNGGLSFEKIINEAPGFILENMPILFNLPYNETQVLHVYGANHNDYGTDINLIQSDGSRMHIHHPELYGSNAVIVSPDNPYVMYFGINGAK